MRTTTRRRSRWWRPAGWNPFQFITGRIGLDGIVEEGFRELIDNKEQNVKILVQPR